MNLADIPTFKGYRTPADSEALERARSQIATGFQQLDIPMTVASGGFVTFNIAGDFLYVDTNPTLSNGVGLIQFNSQQDAGVAQFYAQPGEAWETTFKQISVSWLAQPGKYMRLMYATGDRVAPAFTAATLATIVNAQTNPIFTSGAGDPGIVYGASYKTTSGMAASTPDAVWSAAANVAGVLVHQAEGYSNNATAMSIISLLCKATAPTTVGDGVILCGSSRWHSIAGIFICGSALGRPTSVPAGLRGDWMTAVADVGGVLRSCLYTLK